METLDFDKLPTYIKEKLKIVDSHWIWTGAVTDRSRSDLKGRVRFGGKMEYPHRVVFHLLAGFNLDGPLQANHKQSCPHSLCCNPDCLYAGTQRMNVQDSIKLGHNKELRKVRCSTCGGRYKRSPTTGHRYCQRCKNLRRAIWRINNDKP